jgi:hypothetical protein
VRRGVAGRREAEATAALCAGDRHPFQRIKGESPWFTITLGADFYPTQRIMSGSLEGKGARFTVASWEANETWLDDLPIVEKVGPVAYLALHGTAYAPNAPADAPITAVFDGSLSYCATGGDNPVSFTCSVTPVECQSTHHELKLLPR